MTASSTLHTRLVGDSTDSLLRFALRLDATLSGLAGVGIAAFANPVAELTGITPTAGYVLGAAFVAYGVVVYSLAALPVLRRAGLAVIAANTAYTLGAILVVAEGVVPLTGAGVAACLGSAAYTAAFAVLQYLGVRRLA